MNTPNETEAIDNQMNIHRSSRLMKGQRDGGDTNNIVICTMQCLLLCSNYILFIYMDYIQKYHVYT